MYDVVSLMMNIRHSKHAEDKNNSKHLFKKCILLVNITQLYHNNTKNIKSNNSFMVCTTWFVVQELKIILVLNIYRYNKIQNFLEIVND